MAARYPPGFHNYLGELPNTMDFLDQVAQSDLDPEIIERAKTLHRRAHACATSGDIYAARGLRREVEDIHVEIHKVASYRAFIGRLEEADTANLLACYLPERAWARDWARAPGSANACEFCHWAATRDQAMDCELLAIPLVAVLDRYVDERRRYCHWLRRLVAVVDEDHNLPPRRAPIDNYIVRVAEYSRARGPADNVWTYNRIVATMRETRARIDGTQANGRQLLRNGWQGAIGKMDRDSATAPARVRAFLTPAQTSELTEAIHYDARLYYVARFEIVEGGRCVDQRPRRWVLEHLRAHPPNVHRDRFFGGPLLTLESIWPLYEVDERAGVWVWCLWDETGPERWHRLFVGLLDGGDVDLHDMVVLNQRDEWARDIAIRWLDQERAREDRENETGGDYSDDQGSDRGPVTGVDASLYNADDEAESSEDAAEDEYNKDDDDDDDDLSPQLAYAEMHSHVLDRDRMSQPGEFSNLDWEGDGWVDGYSVHGSDGDEWDDSDLNDASGGEEWDDYSGGSESDLDEGEWVESDSGSDSGSDSDSDSDPDWNDEDEGEMASGSDIGPLMGPGTTLAEVMAACRGRDAREGGTGRSR
ncbi:hypothetical protein CDEST_08299 [Colletotrichum destructivum]|uniref:Uncharacterized protein n=1 Tax=Colletotrichum destructivum TaxID=34406 RepID=A0AAX4IIX1_9PEZI|nr:hypothetical protein CDEST_08299 [Colletotrichum destructivum]